MKRVSFLLPFVVLCAFVIGCGGQAAPVGVSGNVTFDGKPLSNGTITFIPVSTDAGQQRDAKIENGTFELSRAEGLLPELDFKVSIKAFVKTGRKYPNANDAASADEVVQVIPRHYNSDTTLHFRTSKNVRDNQLEFNLSPQLNR